MLKAATMTEYGEKSKIYTEIKWICDKADSLSEGRNNVVHVGYSIDLDQTLSKVQINPRGQGSYSRADKMSNRDVFAELAIVEKNSAAKWASSLTLLSCLIGALILWKWFWKKRRPTLRPHF